MHHERGNSHTSIIDMGITLTGKMIVDSLSASSSINGDSDGNDDLNDIINTGSIAFARSSMHALGQNVLVTVPKKVLLLQVIMLSIPYHRRRPLIMTRTMNHILVITVCVWLRIL